MIDQTQLGNSGLTVSRMALGAMTFGNYSFGTFRARIEQQTADNMVGIALDAGINVFDSAENYGNGQSEELLGRALRNAGARDRVVIATKVSISGGDSADLDSRRLSYRHVVGNAERALKRLGTDWIDLYQLHAPDFVTPWPETLRALDDLVSRGLVRYVGWSNFPAWHAAQGLAMQECHAYAPFVSAQIYYSVVGRHAEHEIIPYCQSAGLGTLIWSPLAGGFLTGKYTRADPTGRNGRCATFHLPPVDLEYGYHVIDAMRHIAVRHDVPIVHVAYAWLLSKPQVTTVIVGASSPDQLAENLAAATFALTDEELADLDSIGAVAPIYPDPRWMTGTDRADDYRRLGPLIRGGSPR